MANAGFRIYTKVARPPRELVESFRGMPVANIADNMNRTFVVDARIRPMNRRPLLGTAVTVKSRTADNLMFHKAIDLAQPGDVILVDVQGDTTNSVTGELMITWAEHRGVAGIVIDGAIRDVDAYEDMEISVYAAGITPKGPYKDGPGEINVPVSIGGVVVKPGDIVVGDSDGIVVIDPKDAPGIIDKVKAMMEREAAIIRNIREKGVWERPWIDATLKEKGCEIID
jgi:RraA family protein